MSIAYELNGKQIDYFNGQFYIDYSLKAFKDSVNNGFDSNKIVMGMLSSQYNPQTIFAFGNGIIYLPAKSPDFFTFSIMDSAKFQASINK